MSRLLGNFRMDQDADDDPIKLDGHEADLEQDNFSTSGSESELSEVSDSDNSFTKGLDSIGRFSNFKIPSFWNNIGQLYNTKGEQPTTNIDVQTISRREQLSNFIEDLKSGFSLQSALDRFQTIRSVLESSINETIDINVDTDVEDQNEPDEEENYEPHVITAAVEPKEVPMLDQVIIPENKEPHRHRHKKKLHKHKHAFKATNSELEELAYISQSEWNDEAVLRKRIKKIRRLSISEDEKNRLTQKLMMGAHYDKIRFVDDNGDEVLQITADKDETKPQAPEEDIEVETTDEEDEDLVIVNDCDKTPSYHNETLDIFGCPHYQRNCKMECPRCKQWVGCPICHDEAITDHKFKREHTRHIMCLKCFNVQEPTEFCDSCDTQFALYFCSKCKLYDNDENKDIYHCDDCGICRLGLGLGQDFFHCKGCNACLSIELQDDHRCIERATQSDCPICGEYMFTSVKPVVFMSCGHAIHQTCYEDHSKHSYKCPTCQKTVLNMEAQFRVLDMEISLQPLPHPYCQWTCVVSCNDCNAKSSCAYHVLGLKCDNCKSYNTVQLKLIKPEESDYESDISTTTNNLRRSNFRNLRNIPISSMHLLNTNYNIEEADIQGPHRVQTNLDNQHDSHSLSHGHHHSRSTELRRDRVESILDGSSTTVIPDEGRILTLPQQLLNNLDSYVNNIQDSSSDGEDDDQDFLRVNNFKNRFKSDILSDNNSASQLNEEETDKDGEKDRNTETDKLIQSPQITGFANAIRDFLASGTLTGVMENVNNDSDDEMDDEYISDENINGF